MLHPDQYQQHMTDYLHALTSGDAEGVASRLSDDIVWHFAGHHPLSGTFSGRENVAAALARFRERSGGTVKLVPGPAMMNGEYAAITLNFSARRPGKSMSMPGIDVFRLGPTGIEEVWLFSLDQDAEDAFWGD